MNSFHRPIEERIESCSSKLMLIPSGLLTTTLLEKQNQFYKKLINKIIYELKGKDELVFFINRNLSRFVPILSVFQNITLKEKCLG